MPSQLATMVAVPALAWRQRLRAMLIHVVISAAVSAAGAAFVFLGWYAGPFAEIAGGKSLFLLIVGVDLVIGPLLTFAVFDKSKGLTLLRRDLMVIAVLQLAAFLYGLHTAYQARPVVLVYEVDQFRVITANEILKSELPAAPPAYRQLPFMGTLTLATRRSKPSEILNSIQTALEGYDIGQRPSYWIEYDAVRQSVPGSGRAMPAVIRHCPHAEAPLRTMLKDRALGVEQVVAVPMTARTPGWSVTVDLEGRILGFLPCDVFEVSRR